MKFARRDVIRVCIVACFVTQLAPYVGIGDPQYRHLYIAPVFALFLILSESPKK